MKKYIELPRCSTCCGLTCISITLKLAGTTVCKSLLDNVGKSDGSKKSQCSLHVTMPGLVVVYRTASKSERHDGCMIVEDRSSPGF